MQEEFHEGERVGVLVRSCIRNALAALTVRLVDPKDSMKPLAKAAASVLNAEGNRGGLHAVYLNSIGWVLEILGRLTSPGLLLVQSPSSLSTHPYTTLMTAAAGASGCICCAPNPWCNCITDDAVACDVYCNSFQRKGVCSGACQMAEYSQVVERIRAPLPPSLGGPNLIKIWPGFVSCLDSSNVAYYCGMLGRR